MQKRVESTESRPTPQFLQFVEAMLGDEPIDPAMLAFIAQPAVVQARAAEDARLKELDWPNLGRYQDDNAATIAASSAAGTRPELVFMGDSISEGWQLADPGFFSLQRLCRGISGQTSAQMLLRFQADVLDLKPAMVHLLAGSNDIAGNTGPTTPYRYQCNIEAMVQLAQANGVAVVLGLLPPAALIPWRPGLDPLPWIAELNQWLRRYAAERRLVLVDYHSVLVDDAGAMRAGHSHDGVHPNRRGYVLMRRALEAQLLTLA